MHSTHRNGSAAVSQLAGMIVHWGRTGEPQPTMGGSKCAQKAPSTPQSPGTLQGIAPNPLDPQSPPMLE